MSSGHHLSTPAGNRPFDCALPGIPDDDPPLVCGGLTVMTETIILKGTVQGDVLVHFFVDSVESESSPLRVRVAPPLVLSGGNKRPRSAASPASGTGTRSLTPGMTV